MAFRAFFAFAFLRALLCAPAQAADPIFPKGSRIGLAPSTGLEASRTFPGFEDTTNKVMILLGELPAQGYEATLKSMQAPVGNAPGISNVKREILLTASGAAHVISANQEHEGTKVRKWMLLTWKAGMDFTVLVTAIVPDAAPRPPITKRRCARFSRRSACAIRFRKTKFSVCCRSRSPTRAISAQCVRSPAGAACCSATKTSPPRHGGRIQSPTSRPTARDAGVDQSRRAGASEPSAPRFAEQLIGGCRASRRFALR